MRVSEIITVVFFVLGMWGFPYLEADVRDLADVRLVDAIVVRAPNVTLGEIASIETEDDLLKKRLINLVVGEAPRVGASKIVSSYKIKGILSRGGLRGVNVHGVQSTVSIETRMMEKDELKKIIRDWVLTKAKKGKQTEVEFLLLPRRWEVPEGEEIEYVVHSSKKKQLGGKQSLTVRAVVGDYIMSSAHARINIAHFSHVPVVIRPLKRGQVLLEDHVIIRRSDVTFSDGMIVGNVEAFVGMIAKRDLPMGKILSVNDFEMPLLIERGSLNRLLVVNGTIRMSIAGAKALQSGKKGESILFSNPLNEKEVLKCRVMEAGLAMINLN
ncbi:MAG: flagella basal body P-ring formation protein FlgA [Chlamydiales bacterium]|jgi:flagella basal body P-ring formation protein FlgA